MTIDSSTARDIDNFLLSPDGINYELEQLVELAGYSAAKCIDDYIVDETSRVLILAGSGNNGADGLVVARQLAILGYSVGVCCPKRTHSELLVTLMHQAVAVGIVEVNYDEVAEALNEVDYVIDAIVGFGFTGSVLRNPWAEILAIVRNSSVPIIGIDVPSGVCIDTAYPQEEINSTCSMLISLTIPKRCVENFTKPHYLTGRFVPSDLLRGKGWPAPEFPDGAEFIRLD